MVLIFHLSPSLENVHVAQVVEFLLDRGADTLWANNKRSSLLHFVMYSSMGEADKEALAEQFIGSGIDVNAQVVDDTTSGLLLMGCHFRNAVFIKGREVTAKRQYSYVAKGSKL